MLQTIVGAQTGEDNLVQEFTAVKTENQQLQANLNAQISLADNLSQKRELIARDLQEKSLLADHLSGQLAETRQKLGVAESKIGDLTSALDGSLPISEPANQISLAWWWLVLGSVATAFLAGGLGYSLARYQSSQDDEFKNPPEIDSFRAATRAQPDPSRRLKKSPAMSP